jgi:hypothetical protein
MCQGSNEIMHHQIGLFHPLDGITNPKYKMLCFLTTKILKKEKKALSFNWDKCCHQALCLQLILFHWKAHFSKCSMIIKVAPEKLLQILCV